MNWIRIATKMKGDPRMGALASACKVRIHEAVGLVCCALMEFPDHARDGNLVQVPDVVLEQWALWTGRPGIFAQAFRAQLCDEDGVVRAWEKHNGAAIREADRTRERARAWREERTRTGRERRTKPVPNGETPPRKRSSERAQYSVDGTGRKETTSAADAAAVVSGAASAASAAASSASRDALFAKLTNPLHRSAAEGYVRSAQHPDSVVSHLDGLLSGLGAPDMRPVSPEVLGQALHEMRVAGIARATASTIAGFVSGVGREPAERRPVTADGTVAGEITWDQLREKVDRGELLAHG